MRRPPPAGLDPFQPDPEHPVLQAGSRNPGTDGLGDTFPVDKRNFRAEFIGAIETGVDARKIQLERMDAITQSINMPLSMRRRRPWWKFWGRR